MNLLIFSQHFVLVFQVGSANGSVHNSDRVNETVLADNGDNDHCADFRGKEEGHVATNAGDRGYCDSF